MAPRTIRTHVPFLALAALLLAAGSINAQNYTFPGIWSQSGRSSDIGYRGFASAPSTLPFPYDGLSGVYTTREESAVPAVVRSTASLYRAQTEQRAYIRLRVPAGAVVLFDEHPTTQTGSERLFITPPLRNGMTYNYRISARWTEDGQDRTVTRDIRILGGQTARVDLIRGQTPTAAAK